MKRWRHIGRGLAIFLVLALLCTGLSGCGKNGIRLSRRMLLQSIGVDRDSSGFQVTVHMAAAGEESDSAEEVVTAQGKSVKDAMNNLTLRNGLDPLYSHKLLLVFGETCAKQGLNSVIDFFVRFSGSNGQMQLAQAEGDAHALLTSKQKDTYVPTRNLLDLLESGSENGKVPQTNLMEFSNLLAGQGSPYLPLIGIEEDQPVAKGMACFFKGFLVNKLYDTDARGALAVMGKVQRTAYVVQVPNLGRVTLNVESLSSKIQPVISGDNLTFQISLECRAAIAAMDDLQQVAPDDKYYQEINAQLQQAIEQEAKSALGQCIAKNTDVFSLTRRLQWADAGYWREKHADFERDLGSAQYTIQVEAEVLRVGQERTPTI